MLSLMEQPLTSAEPEVAGNSPVSMDISVVLPAPLCPRRTVICPSYKFRDTPLTAVFTPTEVEEKTVVIIVKCYIKRSAWNEALTWEATFDERSNSLCVS